MKLNEKVTIIIVTHYSPKQTYGDLAPPSTGIIEETINTLQKNFTGIEACDYDLYYNHPIKDECEKSQDYYRNLKSLELAKNQSIYRTPNFGLKTTVNKALNRISTPFVFFIEHDWRFLKSVDTYKVVETLEENSEINYIRFNYRKNIEAEWDTYVVEDENKKIPLCKVSTFNNHPYIARTNYLKEVINRSRPDPHYWMKILNDDTKNIGNIKSVSKRLIKYYILNQDVVKDFDNIELVTDTNYKFNIEKYGFEEVHKNMGTYLYGSKRSGPFIEHLGR